jgi:hypothetical protein
MRRGNWGGEPEIIALANVHRVKISILTKRNDRLRWHHYGENIETDKWFWLYHEKKHYENLVRPDSVV